MQRLMLTLMLVAIMSLVPAVTFAGQDDQGEDNDDQGMPIVIKCPPTGCIQ